MNTVDLLSNTGYIMYNKQLSKLLGIYGAILVGELCAKHQYWEGREELQNNAGWFYLTRNDIEDDTGLSAKQQRPAFDLLQEFGLVECKLMGVPARMFYRLNIENLDNLMCPKVTTGSAQRSQQVVPKGQNINKVSKKETKKETKRGTFENTEFSVQLEAALNKWIVYKNERNESYKPEGLNALLAQIRHQLTKSSEQEVIDLIQLCMANGWKGITWDKLKPAAPQNASAKTGASSSIDMDRLHEMLHRGDAYG